MVRLSTETAFREPRPIQGPKTYRPQLHAPANGDAETCECFRYAYVHDVNQRFFSRYHDIGQWVMRVDYDNVQCLLIGYQQEFSNLAFVTLELWTTSCSLIRISLMEGEGSPHMP